MVSILWGDFLRYQDPSPYQPPLISFAFVVDSYLNKSPQWCHMMVFYLHYFVSIYSLAVYYKKELSH